MTFQESIDYFGLTGDRVQDDKILSRAIRVIGPEQFDIDPRDNGFGGITDAEEAKL